MNRVFPNELQINGIVQASTGQQGIVLNVTILPKETEVEVQTDSGRETWLLGDDEQILFKPTENDWLAQQETLVHESVSEILSLNEDTSAIAPIDETRTQPALPSTLKTET